MLLGPFHQFLQFSSVGWHCIVESDPTDSKSDNPRQGCSASSPFEVPATVTPMFLRLLALDALRLILNLKKIELLENSGSFLTTKIVSFFATGVLSVFSIRLGNNTVQYVECICFSDCLQYFLSFSDLLDLESAHEKGKRSDSRSLASLTISNLISIFYKSTLPQQREAQIKIVLIRWKRS